jgi:hypothetical protein
MLQLVTDFLVKRDDLHETRIDESSEPPPVEDGQALLRVDRFGLTANNVTYAVFGDAMSYWRFFPGPEGWGRVPMWGFAEVETSRADGLSEGQRVYGYLPPSSWLVVTPGDVGEHGFTDASPHRAKLPGAYQGYTSVDGDPFYRQDTEDVQMLLRPLFFTSYLIDDQLADDGLTGRGPVLISSASSKTAIGTAFLLAQRDGAEIVGLTSERSTEFVEGLGIYSRTVTYDAVDSLDARPATFVDIAGDAAVRQAVHSHFGDELAYSMVVGATHWEQMAAGAGLELAGPTPAFFFAPDRVVKRSKDWGGSGLQQRAADAWHPFCDWLGGWLEVQHGEGFEAVRDAYLAVLDGRVEPAKAHVLAV